MRTTGNAALPLMLCALATSAAAQTVLPEIVVTAPSPLVAPWEQGVGGGAPELIVRPVVDGVFAPVSILTRSEILRTPAATIGDLVSSLPGVTSTSFAAGANRPIVRGLDNFRVRLQENGVGAMDVSAIGEDHGVPIDPLAAQKVEVLRGPSTLRWGTQAIGGVVDVSNNRIPTLATRPGLSFESRGAMTSLDRGGEAAVLLDARGEQVAIHADAYRRVGSDYATPSGRQANTALSMEGASVGASWLFDSGYVGAALTQFNSLYRVPGDEAAANGVRIDMQQTRATAKGEFNIGGGYLQTVRFWFGATQYRHDERAFDAGLDTIKGTFRNREMESRIELQSARFQTGLGEWTSALGAQFGAQKLGAAGEASNLLPPADVERRATYVFNELNFAPTWRAQAAARLDHVSVGGVASLYPADYLPPVPFVDPAQAARTRTFLPTSFSLGLLHDLPNGVVASLTMQRVQRSPEALELFARGPHEATGTFEIGDPNMRVEQAQSIEFGLRRARGDFRFDFSAYRTAYRGYIFKRFTGALCGEDFSSCGVETDLRQIVYAQRDASFTGAELSVQYDTMTLATGLLGIDGQFDMVRARFSDGVNVPRIPPMRLGAGVFWRNDVWFARVGLLHAFGQTRIDPAEETATSGYNLLKAEVSYRHRWTSAMGPLEATFGITGTNLLNEDVRNHVSFKKDEVLQPGRGVRLFTNVKF